MTLPRFAISRTAHRLSINNKRAKKRGHFLFVALRVPTVQKDKWIVQKINVFMQPIAKPKEGEFPFDATIYIQLLPDDGLLLKHLQENFIAMKQLVLSLPEEKLNYRYAQNKWTIKEILVHIIDGERVFSYRALRFARNDKTELPGFEQDDYTFYSGANERSIDNIFEEYEAVRNATIALFNGLPEDSLLRMGTANNNKATVRAMAYQIAGHELHHMNIIKERYL